MAWARITMTVTEGATTSETTVELGTDDPGYPQALDDLVAKVVALHRQAVVEP